jgi:probable selenium-dependent hydroxylase accessory protein YqeC
VAEPIELNQLARALNFGPREHIALVGGGGKTTIMHALGRQLKGRVIVTTTTKMGSDQDEGFSILAASDVRVDMADVGTSIVWSRVDGNKAYGVSKEECDRWAEYFDYVVIEADGARQRPFKAPASYEPVIPSTVTQVVSVIGADALGRVIADQCHRPMRVAALAGCEPYHRLSPGGAAAVLLHQRGARKAIPESARFTVAVNKVDDTNREFVDELVDELLSREPGLPVIPIQADPTTHR